MSTNLPKFRTDLIVSRQARNGESVFVIKDPVTRQFFRLQEADYYIARQLDGATDLETVRRRVEQKFESPLAAAALADFVRSLNGCKLLDGGNGAPRLREKPRRVEGNLLFLRVRLVDPDRLFSWLAGKVRFLFTPHFVVFSALAILWAVGIVLSNLGALAQGIAQLWSWNALVPAWATVIAVLTLHEFGHGLTCKHFGGEVREIGVLLIYLQPAFYCNVSDAWLFPERSRRLWVGFAGPFFELFLWALATFAWRITDFDTIANYLALIIMTTSGVKTLFNFNPLIKLDGYYLLSDLLEIHNLRGRAFQYVGNGMKRLMGLEVPPEPEMTRREKLVFLVYGLIGSVGSLLLVIVTLVTVGGVLVENQQALAFMVFTGFLGKKLHKRWRRLFSNNGDTSDPDEDDGGPESRSGESESRDAGGESKATQDGESVKKPEDESTSKQPEDDRALNRPVADAQQTPEPSESSATSKAAQRRKKRSTAWLVVRVTVLSGVLGALLWWGQLELRITGPFIVLPIHNADARSEVDGTIEELYVDEGTSVRQGDLIARLSDRDNRALLQKIEAQIAQTQATLKMLEAGPRPEEIELAQATVLRAEEKRKFARSNLERDRRLFEQNLLARKDFETTEQTAVDAENALIEAQKQLNVLRAGARPEEIEATKANIAGLESQRKYLEEQVASARVVSPADGIIVTPSRQLEQMKHQAVKQGDLIAKVYDINTVDVQTPVSEKDIADIRIGQEVVLKTRAYPDQTFFGTVMAIGTTVQDLSSSTSSSFASSGGSQGGSSRTSAPAAWPVNTVLVTTRIKNESLLLKPGMTGNIKVSCGQRRAFDLVTRRLARTIKVEFWSWW